MSDSYKHDQECTPLCYVHLGLIADLQRTSIQPEQGRAIAQAVSRWLPTAAARVQTRV
jgi:uncharacterized protein YejL (UPF0352 family)